jgi:fibronectin-binding autotransporter adhesin
MKWPIANYHLLVVAWMVLGSASARAAITWNGDIDPSSPTTWTSSTDGYIGKSSDGSIAVDGGSELLSRFGYLGDSSDSAGEVTVSGAGSVWNGKSSLYVGRSGHGTLNIQPGGRVANSFGYLGFYPGSTGAATVSGTGAKWNNSWYLAVGHSGRGTLNIQAGGTVTNTIGSLGNNPGSTGEATISGTNSLWSNSDKLRIGERGTGTLNIHAGGMVTDTDGHLGYFSGSTGYAVVTGTGSQWTNSGDLYFGYQGGAGTLHIQAGGTVSNTDGYLGYYSGVTAEATVNGTNSLWTNSGILYIGGSGSGTLRVEDGGQVTAGTLYASLADLHGDGTITATKGAVIDGDLLFDATHGAQSVHSFGSGGVLTVMAGGGVLAAGYKSAGSLTITDGVAVNSSTGYVSYDSGSTGNATVSGIGSRWTNSSNLLVGNKGSGTLSIQAGGTVTNNHGYLGFYQESTGEATVSGIGSQWSNNGDLFVGYYGGGSLKVEAGGTVTSARGLLKASNNVTVTGAGSRWINSRYLHADGTLNIQAGGTVNSFGGSLGSTAHSIGEVMVTGTGSRWISSSDLYVGSADRGKLDIQAGGTVTNTDGYLGRWSGSTGEATISGTGSQWDSSGDLYVGSYGRGTLKVESGASVTNTDGYVGYYPVSRAEVVISGSAARWTNSGDLIVGYQGSGTLTISHRALVSVAGALTVDQDLSGEDSFIKMSTGGTLALVSDETADDSLGNFLALVGGTKAIQYWDNDVADWASITAATYGDDFILEYRTTGDLAGYTLLTVGQLPPLSGDYNADGVVDAADYTVWRDNLGGPAGTLSNDFDGGEIGAAQYDTWSALYGSVSAPSALGSNAAVPEPSGGLLALGWLVKVAFSRRVQATT